MPVLTSAPGPALTGLTVVEVDGGEAGAIAGMILAEHGATVTKIEPPAGAPQRSLSGADAWDRGKGSVVIDPAAEGAAAALAEAIASVDVVVHGRGDLAGLLDQAERLLAGTAAARRIRSSIETTFDSESIGGQLLRVTCSGGIATLTPESSGPHVLFGAADRALYA